MFESLTSSIQKVFSRWGRDRALTPENIRAGIEEIRKALLEADVHFQVARDLIARVTERAIGTKTIAEVSPAEQIIKIFSDVLTEAMHGEAPKIPLIAGAPAVLMMVGLQGSGKTTTAAKLARKLARQGRRPLLVAADVQRPAAVRQLQVLGERISVPVHFDEGVSPPKICMRAVKRAASEGFDVVILDTAGRLHIDEPLMRELDEIAKETSPHLRFLVCDSMAGQDAYTSAREFHGRLELDALILTKLDGDTRGGAAISVRQVTGKPVAYIGTGEGIGDLDEFHADRMASRILGMGDVVSLVEKAQEVMDRQAAEEATERLLRNRFTFHDFLTQLRALKKMGPLQGILKLLPGGLGEAFSRADVGDREMSRVEAVILSMTEQERLRPEIIDASRKRRISRGSGTDVSHVNQLLRQFDQLRQMMKSFGGGGMLSKMGGLLGGSGLFPGSGGAGAPGESPLGSRMSKEQLLSKLRGKAQLVGSPTDRAAAQRKRKQQKDARKKNRKRR